MERFGIFELLDALSALPREGADQRAEAGRKTPAKEDRLGRAAPPEGGAARSSGTEKAPFPDGRAPYAREDGSFSPAAGEGAPPAPKAPDGRAAHDPAPKAPDGRAAHDPAPNAPDGRAAHDPAPKALESFLQRHDALSKKAEKH